MPARDWKRWVDNCVALGSIATAVGVMFSIYIGSKSVDLATEAVRVSSAQLAHSQQAFLAFDKGDVSLSFEDEMVFTANEAKLKNFGTSPAMNVRVRWLKSIEGSADLYTKEHESEISPFHLLPSEITKLQESNISGLLEPGSKDGKARRWLGVLFISWTGVDQNHHYTKQQYSVEWSPNPDPAKTTPVCTILFGDVVRYGTREVRDATSRTE